MAITGYFIDADWVYREVLLAFKPLSGSHSGTDLSKVVEQTLTQHAIKDRIFGLTTDNASNNKTLVDELQQLLQANIIRVPCLAHVIQLSLNQLLDRLKAVPQNPTAETIWTEEQETTARASTKKREIAHTLQRIRALAVYIRASPQRRDSFLALQPDGKRNKLMLIQDVKTRWNSTYLMLRRAKKLQRYIIQFCAQYNEQDFALDDDQWRQIDYLLCLTKQFYDCTVALSKTREVTSHLVFAVYNLLFEHIERSQRQLRPKRVTWKQQMFTALQASWAKLHNYYKQTDQMRGYIYPVCTMLSPEYRFQFFLSDDWSGDIAKELRDEYREAFQDALTPIQQRLAKTHTPQEPSTPTSRSILHDLIRNQKPNPKSKSAADEITQYLDGTITESDPLAFWRQNEQRFPAIAALAQDYLAMPASGAGVERLFNIARDICHYRRGYLKPSTIEELMLYLCASKFDLGIQESEEMKQYYSSNEMDILVEEKDQISDDFEVDEISDTEDQSDLSVDLIDDHDD
ncbi:hypothetical protein PENVUL_c153G05266, partial [Penicillium vulpinum]